MTTKETRNMELKLLKSQTCGYVLYIYRAVKYGAETCIGWGQVPEETSLFLELSLLSSKVIQRKSVLKCPSATKLGQKNPQLEYSVFWGQRSCRDQPGQPEVNLLRNTMWLSSLIRRILDEHFALLSQKVKQKSGGSIVCQFAQKCSVRHYRR